MSGTELRAAEFVLRGGARLLFALLCPAAASLPQEPAIRVETALVQVPVLVRDTANRSIPDLNASDFTLLDDGVPQAFPFFGKSGEPIRVALLLDTSKSTVTVLPRIRRAAERFLGELAAQDRAAVYTFDSEVRRVCAFTGDTRELRDSIRGVKPGEIVGTRLRDAIRTAAAALSAEGGRKAVIVLSDGEDYGSEIAPADLEGLLSEENVVVYPVLYTVDVRELARKLFGVRSRLPRDAPDRDIRSPRLQERERQARSFMEGLAKSSAGSFHPIELTDLSRTFAAIAAELREQYWLGFYPAANRRDGELHALEVRVRREGAATRHRLSYRIRR